MLECRSSHISGSIQVIFMKAQYLLNAGIADRRSNTRETDNDST